MMRGLVTALVLALTMTWFSTASEATSRGVRGGIQIYQKTGVFDEVRQDLMDAIINRGFVVDFNGRVGEMLKRTAKDIRNAETPYKNAEFFIFCSAKVSHQLSKVDPRNVGFCPYTVFVYELKKEPGVIRVGYRQPAIQGSEESRKALLALDKLLDGIAREAIQ